MDKKTLEASNVLFSNIERTRSELTKAKEMLKLANADNNRNFYIEDDSDRSLDVSGGEIIELLETYITNKEAILAIMENDFQEL